jgi:hypothetical protein
MGTFKGINTVADLKALCPNAEIEPEPKKGKIELIQSTFDAYNNAPGLLGCWALITLGIETASEANGRDWKARNRRGGAAWKAVSRLCGRNIRHLAPLAEHYYCHDGALKIVFARIGGRKMDRSNLPAAMKAVEDALAFMLGADDGDPRWQAEWEQQPGPGPVGVSISIKAI